MARVNINIQDETCIDCPLCKDHVHLAPKANASEQQHNELLLGFQDAVLRYKCFFEPEGCNKTFLKDDLMAHIETCECRKYMCTYPGCGEALFFHELKNHSHSMTRN